MSLQEQYNTYKTQLQQLSQKAAELQSESEEHKLVLETLRAVDSSRRCFRMVGSVLVERSAGQVIPTLEQTKEGLDKAVVTLKSDFSKTEKELDSWKKKNNVKVVSN